MINGQTTSRKNSIKANKPAAECPKLPHTYFFTKIKQAHYFVTLLANRAVSSHSFCTESTAYY